MTFQTLVKAWWLVSSVVRYHHVVTFSKKVATAKAFVTPERLPPHRLQQAFIANECIFKSWYGWGLPLKWTKLNGDANPLHAAADAADSPALLLVDLAKLKTVTIQTTLKKLILKRRRRMTLKTERAWTYSMEKGVLAWWQWTVEWHESNFIMIHQLSDIETGLNVFLAPKNQGINTKIITFEWFVSEFWQ